MISPRQPPCFWNNDTKFVQWNMNTTCSNTYSSSRKLPVQTLKVCFSSRVLDDGRCVLNCPSGKFEFMNQCHLCHSTCQECQGNEPSSCTSCGVGEGVWWLTCSMLLQTCSPRGQYLIGFRSFISGDKGLRLDSCSLKNVYNLEVSVCCQNTSLHHRHRLTAPEEMREKAKRCLSKEGERKGM